MADKITETDVVQIQAQDSDGNKYSFNVENPKTSTTIENVREAFQPLINSGKWISKQGYPFSYIPQATVTKTKKIQLDDGTGTVTVTPTQYSGPRNSNRQTTFTVDGSPIKGYAGKQTRGTYTISLENPVINATNNTLTVNININQNANQDDTGVLTIVTEATKIEIPISVT